MSMPCGCGCGLDHFFVKSSKNIFAPEKPQKPSLRSKLLLQNPLRQGLFRIEQQGFGGRCVHGDADPADVAELGGIGIGHDVARYYQNAVTVNTSEDLALSLVEQLEGLFKGQG
ncbi:MAG: cobaltochelatase CobT-related protein [Holosporales bacterium]